MSSPILLSVSAAAERLGVHVGTVRRWTDDGVLPEARTPGGHRRIPVEAVERLRRERTTGGGDGAEVAVQAWADRTVTATREELADAPDADWNRAFQGTARAHRRETGRQLVGLLLRHVAGTGDAEARDAEIRRLAWGYALDMKDRGLPISEALRATLFFRDVLTESTVHFPTFEDQAPTNQIALMRRVNEFMNVVQLTIARAYESDGAVSGVRSVALPSPTDA